MRAGNRPELATAIEAAVAGKPADLYRRLELGSGLPGPRMNIDLATAFGEECVGIGPKVDALTYRMAELPPDEARGASPKEFLSVCGVLAIAVRATTARENASRDKAIALLEAKADDPRFRVRDAVPIALAILGSKMHIDLTDRLEPWMDRYFHATAVILALAEPRWLETFKVDDFYQPINLLHDAFVLARDAPRSAARYPGHKALVEALGTVPKAIAKRFGLPMFDRLEMWCEGLGDPELRAAILANLEDAQLKKPFANEIKRIKNAVEGSKKPPRDPTRLIQGMRSRGKKHKAKR